MTTQVVLFHTRKCIATPVEKITLHPILGKLIDPKAFKEARPIATPHQRVLAGHHHGFVQDIGSPAFLAARCYDIVRAALSVGDDDVPHILETLDTLLRQIKDIKSYKMPLNTSRVMLAILRNAVDHGTDPVNVFENLQLFKTAVSGDPSTIRKLLKKLQMPELPEGKPLHQLGIAWDDGVYDSSTTGKKSTVQIIMDAYIKGLSSITISQTNTMNVPGIRLGLEAGKILGVNVRYSLEFSFGPANTRHTFIIYLPGCHTLQDYQTFLQAPELRPFFATLRQHTENRNEALHRLIERFNQHYLALLNSGWNGHPELCLPLQTFDHIAADHPEGSLSRIHLGVSVVKDYLAVLKRRITYLEESIGQTTDKSALTRQQERLRELNFQLTQFNTYDFIETYFDKKNGYDYHAPIANLPEYLKQITQLGGQIVLAQPLAQDVAAAAQVLIDYVPFVSGLEIYNTRLYFNQPQKGLPELTLLVNLINQRDLAGLQKHLNKLFQGEATAEQTPDIPAFIQQLQQSSYFLHPVFRSDSNGYKSYGVPGMGFFLPDLLTEKELEFPDNTSAIPIAFSTNAGTDIVSQLAPMTLEHPASIPDAYRYAGNNFQVINSYPVTAEPNQYQENKQFVTISRIFRFPNPWIKNPISIATGFLIATSLSSFSIGLPLTVAWFALSMLNDYLLDMVSNGNYNPRNWELRKFNMTKASTSLFYTGMAIVFLKLTDHVLTPFMGSGGGLLELYALSLGILTAKGIFEYCKQRAMGANTTSAKWGFGRMFIAAIPLTLMESILSPYLPRVVQAKVWDEMTKHFLSIGLKVREFTRVREKDYQRLLSGFNELDDLKRKKIQFLDILYIWKEMPEGYKTLKSRLMSTPQAELDPLLGFANRDDILTLFDLPGLDPKYLTIKEKLSDYLPEFREFLRHLKTLKNEGKK